MELRGLVSIGLLSAATVATVAIAAPRDVPARKLQLVFVQSAKGAALDGGKLTLQGVSPTTVYFSDRPDRIAGHLATTAMIPLWSEGRDSFTKHPPSATLSAFGNDGTVANVVVALSNPQLTGDQLVYDVELLDGKLPAAADAASLFIDVIGMPLTPLRAGAMTAALRR
jgi:hypothetical protein